jgi:hypothetical protein
VFNSLIKSKCPVCQIGLSDFSSSNSLQALLNFRIVYLPSYMRHQWTFINTHRQNFTTFPIRMFNLLAHSFGFETLAAPTKSKYSPGYSSWTDSRKKKKLEGNNYNCPLCSMGREEIIFHLFFFCPFSQHCWNHLNIN